LLDLVSLAREKHSDFIALLFPHLLAREQSADPLNRAKETLSSAGSPVIDLRDSFKGIPGEELIANSVDAHPNSRAHAVVEKVLAEYLCRTMQVACEHG
jgi:hypothetical protein